METSHTVRVRLVVALWCRLRPGFGCSLFVAVFFFFMHQRMDSPLAAPRRMAPPIDPSVPST